MSHLAGGALVAVVSVLAFALLIVVHELGHHLAARASRMRVERFSIGFGPALWKRRSGETEWAISALPLGGYVRIAGMNPGEEIAPGDAAAYCNQPAWRRFAVILAGPAMNYVTALLLAVLLVLGGALREADPSATLGDILAGSPAEAAGLRSRRNRSAATDAASSGCSTLTATRLPALSNAPKIEALPPRPTAATIS